MNKNIVILILIIVETTRSMAGDWTLTTSPTYVTSPNDPKAAYIAIDKNAATTTGISFSATTMQTYGSITNWSWSFTNGSPSTWNAQSPPTIMFTSSAYGLSNYCEADFQHNGSGSSGTCSSPFIPIYVNVVKPQVAINNSSGWSSMNSVVTSWATTLKFATTSPTIGVLTSFSNSGVTPAHGTPAEYQLSALPANCGAVNTQFSIYESAVSTYVGYTSSASTTLFTTTQTHTYNPGNFDTCAAGSTVAPANPLVFTCDPPGSTDAGSEYYLNSNSAYQRVVETQVLTETPLYQSSTNPPDTSLSTSYTVTLVIRHNGPGLYTWDSK
jgi:hypothetical protein